MTPEQEQAVRERLTDIELRLDDPKLGNPKYAMDRRAIESELRAVAHQALSAIDAARADLASMVATANAVAGQRDEAREDAERQRQAVGDWYAEVVAARAERDALVGGIEVEWYNGNIDETARDRLIGIYGDIPEADTAAYRDRIEQQAAAHRSRSRA